MFGVGFIIIGIVILLETAGVFGSISPGIIWGLVFIAVGAMIMMRSSARRERRREWMARHRDRMDHGMHGAQGSDRASQRNSNSDASDDSDSAK